MSKQGFMGLHRWVWRLGLAVALLVALTAARQETAPVHAGPIVAVGCACPVGPYVDPLPGSYPAVKSGSDPSVGYSPNGTYKLTVSGTGPVNLTVTRVAGGATVLNQSVDLQSGWGFSPDDDRFTIHSLISGQESVYLYNLTGAAPNTAVWSGGSTPNSSRLAFSPNGHYFMYESVSSGNNTSLTIVDVVTGAAKYSTSFAFQTPPGSTEDTYGVVAWGFSPEDADHGFVFAYVSGQSSVELRLVNLGLAGAPRLVYSETISAASAFWQFSPCGDVLGLVTQVSSNQQRVRLFRTADGSLVAGSDQTLALENLALSSKLAAPDSVEHWATLTSSSVKLATLVTPGACVPGAPVVSTVKLNPSSLQGGSPSTGTVSLNQPAPGGGTPVALSSSNTSVAITPANVTVASGSTSATFTVTTKAVSTNSDATISASAGGVTRSALLTVTTPPPALASLTLSPTAVTGGYGSTATITLTQPAGTGGVLISLQSDSPTASVPGSVTIPTSATSWSFPISTNPVATATSATITASFGGVSKTGTITVNPPTLSRLTVPTKITGGAATSGTVVLTGPAPAGGGNVDLTSSDPATAAVSTPVQVPSRSTSADFAITTYPVSTATSVTITASFGGSNLTGNLTVNPAQIKSLTVNRFRVEGGNDASGTVTLDTPAGSAGIVVTLTTSNSTLTTPPPSVTVQAGSTTTTFTVHTKAVQTPIEVTLTGKTGSAAAGARLRLIPPPLYTITDLGAVPGATGSFASGINASGEVVGSSGGSAFLYRSGTMSRVPTPIGFDSAGATAINAAGQIALNAYTNNPPYDTSAFFYDPNTNTFRRLGSLGGTNSWAFGINDSGQVVGVANTPTSTGSSPTGHAFLWDPATNVMQDLGTLGGPTSQALGINARGQVTGVADFTANPGNYDWLRHAFLYDGASRKMTDLGSITSGSRAPGINAWGQVVGWSDNFQDNRSPVLYDSNGMQDLGPCSSTNTCEARAINDLGKIVANSGQRVQLYGCGQWSLINDVISADSVFDMRNSEVAGINNAGQVVGTGYSTGFLLTPISASDAALSATGGSSVTAVDGKSFSLRVADFTDADPRATASCFLATSIEWGDGTISTGAITARAGGGFSVTGKHAYARNGSYTYTVTVRDVEGATATVTGSATVTEAPMSGVGTSISATPATVFSGVVGGIADENPIGDAAELSASIDWGDGSATSTGTVASNGKGGFDVSGTHTYAKGLYRITIAVTDSGGSSTTIESTANAGVDAVATLPVMSNKAYGGYLTTALLQNTGAGPAAVLIRYYDQSGKPVGDGDLRLNLPVNGNWTVRQDNGRGLPAGGAGSAIVFSTQPLAAFVNEAAPGAGSDDGSGYTALQLPGGGGTTLYAPAIFNGGYGGYFTGIGLTNLGSAATDVTITYRGADGTVVKTQTLNGVPALAYRSIYQGDAALGLPDGFVGSASISSSGQPLAAIINEVGNNGFSSYAALTAGHIDLQAPVALNNAFGGYSTGMAIQNTGNSAGTLTLTYYDSAGVATVKTVAIGANAALGIYQGDAALGPAPGSYTARLSSTVPIAAIVNEVFGPNPSLFTTYNAFAGGLASSHLALVQNSGLDGLSTGLGIMNLGSGSATVTISYFGADSGAPITSKVFTLGAGAFLPRYTPDDLPTRGTRATAVVSSTAELAVICNEVAPGTFMSYAGQ